VIVQELGRIVRLQVQVAPLKRGTPPDRYYDTERIRRVDALTVTGHGVIGHAPDAPNGIVDVHHRDHPRSRHRGDNGISVLTTGHYERMRAEFGPHLVDGVAAENVLLDRAGWLDLEDLVAGIVVVAHGQDAAGAATGGGATGAGHGAGGATGGGDKTGRATGGGDKAGRATGGGHRTGGATGGGHRTGGATGGGLLLGDPRPAEPCLEFSRLAVGEPTSSLKEPLRQLRGGARGYLLRVHRGAGTVLREGDRLLALDTH
jgi:hypothetical protein